MKINYYGNKSTFKKLKLIRYEHKLRNVEREKRERREREREKKKRN